MKADTLAGAVAETLGDPALLAAARAAYTSGLHAVAGVGAALFLGLAVLTVTVLRASCLKARSIAWRATSSG
ncbi:hypothetical protein AB0K48_58605 [Nonomuraea sp. NPDC055795]